MEIFRRHQKRWRKVALAPRATPASALEAKSRGQSLVEMALLLPLLVLLLAIVVEAGLAFNTWIRVNTAARDATRFALDAGRPDQTAALVRQKLGGVDENQLNVHIITGTTNLLGNINSWDANHAFLSPDPSAWAGLPHVTTSTIQTRLRNYDVQASRNMKFKIVEVNYRYTPLVLGLILGATKIPMTSYAIVQY